MVAMHGRQIAAAGLLASTGFFGGWMIAPRGLAEQAAPAVPYNLPVSVHLSDAPAFWPAWLWQWYMAALLAAVFGLLLWLFHHLRERQADGARSKPSRDPEIPAALNPWMPVPAIPGSIETAAAPRELLSNPWLYPDNSLMFDDRVRLAVEGSLRASRVLGVVYFSVGTSGDTARIAARISNEFRGKLRRTDHVKVETNANGMLEITVFAPLLRNRSELTIIAERLMTAAHYIAIDCKQLHLSEPGLAMYPIDGYEGEYLIASARANAQGDACCISREGVVQLAARRVEVASA